MEAKDGSFGFDFEGVYDGVITNEKISYTLLDDRKVTITFSQTENGVQITETFEAETKKLLDALSAGGIITMELQDKFWGAYYGSCTDKFGVNWMFNCVEKV